MTTRHAADYGFKSLETELYLVNDGNWREIFHTDMANNWDDNKLPHAIFSARLDVYGYVHITVTGRVVREIPGMAGTYGLKVRYTYSEGTADGWVCVPGGQWFDKELVKEI